MFILSHKVAADNFFQAVLLLASVLSPLFSDWQKTATCETNCEFVYLFSL